MTRGRWILFALIAFLLFAGVVKGGATGGKDRPGDPDVYEHIESLTDCSALEAELESAQSAAGEAQADSPELEAAVAYEEAAFDRLEHESCLG